MTQQVLGHRKYRKKKSRGKRRRRNGSDKIARYACLEMTRKSSHLKKKSAASAASAVVLLRMGKIERGGMKKPSIPVCPIFLYKNGTA